MKIFTSAYFDKQLRKLIKKHPNLPNLLDTKFEQFLQNPKHPSLRVHKLKGNLKSQWSIRIKADIRVLFVYVKNGILITNIGPHDVVY